MTDISIQAAVRQDCAAIAEIGRAVWGEWANGMPLPIQLIELKHPVFVAKNTSGTISGYCVGVARADGLQGHILSVTVLEEYRRSGLGETLVRRVLREFLCAGASPVTAMVSQENHGSLAMFRKIGFEEQEQIEGYYAPGERVLRLGFTLSELPA